MYFIGLVAALYLAALAVLLTLGAVGALWVAGSRVRLPRVGYALATVILFPARACYAIITALRWLTA